MLLPLAQAYRVPLDDLVGAPEVADPRVRFKPHRVNGRTVLPLTGKPGGMQAWKIIVPATKTTPELKAHEGYEWLYVLAWRMRLLLGDHDLMLGAGEVAEFDTQVPHWFGSTREGPAEILSMFGPQGERMHVRAKSGRSEPAPAERCPTCRPVIAPGQCRAPPRRTGTVESVGHWHRLCDHGLAS